MSIYKKHKTVFHLFFFFFVFSFCFRMMQKRGQTCKKMQKTRFQFVNKVCSSLLLVKICNLQQFFFYVSMKTWLSLDTFWCAQTGGVKRKIMDHLIKVTFKVRALSTLVESKSGHWKNSILFSCFLVIDLHNFYSRIFQFTRFGFQYWRNSLTSFTVFTIWKKYFCKWAQVNSAGVTLNDILKFDIQSGA